MAKKNVEKEEEVKPKAEETTEVDFTAQLTELLAVEDSEKESAEKKEYRRIVKAWKAENPTRTDRDWEYVRNLNAME